MCENAILISRINRKIFQLSLLWPSDGTELNPGIKYKMRIFTFFFLTFSLVLFTSIHFFLARRDGEPIDAEEVAVILAAYGTFYMIIAHLRKQPQVALLLRDLSNFEKFGKPPNFETRNKQLDFGVKLLFLYSVVATVLYSFLKFLEKGGCKKRHDAKGWYSNHCGLIVPMWFPIKIDYFPMFHLVFLYCFCVAHLLIKMCLFISFTALECAHHIILRIEHLKSMILECLDDDNSCEEKLKTCISYHIEILELATRLKDTFFNSMFGHFALTGAICACLEKQIMDGINQFAGILHFLGWIVSLFVGCTGGQHFLNANDIIPEALWNTKWYQAKAKIRRDIVFMLARSQKNVYIRAGPFGILSYPLFITVLKMSYSILCVLSS